MTSGTEIKDGTVWWIVKASDQTVRGSGYDREDAELWVQTEGKRNVEYELYRVETKGGNTRAKKITSLTRSK